MSCSKRSFARPVPKSNFRSKAWFHEPVSLGTAASAALAIAAFSAVAVACRASSANCQRHSGKGADRWLMTAESCFISGSLAVAVVDEYACSGHGQKEEPVAQVEPLAAGGHNSASPGEQVGGGGLTLSLHPIAIWLVGLAVARKGGTDGGGGLGCPVGTQDEQKSEAACRRGGSGGRYCCPENIGADFGGASLGGGWHRSGCRRKFGPALQGGCREFGNPKTPPGCRIVASLLDDSPSDKAQVLAPARVSSSSPSDGVVSPLALPLAAFGRTCKNVQRSPFRHWPLANQVHGTVQKFQPYGWEPFETTALGGGGEAPALGILRFVAGAPLSSDAEVVALVSSLTWRKVQSVPREHRPCA
mmetsp:Transcript_58915/g.127415  ORF Transcript_58915/g.127415 Transcript_58915/m.127415 type:complete len:360 (-) Transcript_58915:8-1087(-)